MPTFNNTSKKIIRKKKTSNIKSPSVVSDSDIEDDVLSDGVVSEAESSNGGSAGEEVEETSNAETEDEQVEETIDEVAVVKGITGEAWGSDFPSVSSGLLTQEQLAIAEKEEAEAKKSMPKDSKGKQPRMTRPSLANGFKLEKPAFNEMVKQYTQEDGSNYTKEAFASAMNYWVFQHCNIANAYARSGKTIYKTKQDGTASKEIEGVEMPDDFWSKKFLNGWFMTAEAKEQLEIAEEIMREKRVGKGKAKAKVVSKAVKEEIANEAIGNLSMEELMKLLEAKKANQ